MAAVTASTTRKPARARLTGKQEAGAPRTALETPAITRVEVEAGASGLLAVDFRVAADSSSLYYSGIAIPGIRSVRLHFADRRVDLTASAGLSDAEPAAPAREPSAAVNAVRALPAIVVHTPAPPPPELEEIELTLDWFAPDTPASGFAPARLDDALKSKLGALLDRLTRAHVAYERADAASERTRKRSARNLRRAAALELSVLLTQIGEAELVEGLARSATERKIELVRGYLAARGGEPT